MKKSAPEVSIIIPIYNAENYLKRSIDSVRNQTIHNIEIILIDDGSTDESGKMCDHYQIIDSRIVVIHKKNEGQYHARRLGVEIARAEYVGFVDADDWIEPDMYEVLLEYANRYDVSVVESGVIDDWGEHKKKRKNIIPKGYYKGEYFDREIQSRFIYAGEFFSHGISPYLWSKIFKKSIIEIPQNVDYRVAEMCDDVVVVWLTLLNTRSIYITDECFYHYCVRIESSKRTRNEKDTCGALKILSHILEENSSEKWKLIERQVLFYSLYRLLLDNPSFFLGKDKKLFKPIPNLKIGNKIILYGAGVAGITWYNFLKEYVDIVSWVDIEYRFISQYLPVKSPQLLLHKKYDYVVIAILREQAVYSVKKELLQMGISKEKILWISDDYLNMSNKLWG